MVCHQIANEPRKKPDVKRNFHGRHGSIEIARANFRYAGLRYFIVQTILSVFSIEEVTIATEFVEYPVAIPAKKKPYADIELRAPAANVRGFTKKTADTGGEVYFSRS